MTYKFTLEENEFKLVAISLDSYTRALCSSIQNAQSAGETLKITITKLKEIDELFAKLNEILSKGTKK